MRRAVRLVARIVLVLMLLPVAWVALYTVVDPPGGFYMAEERLRLGPLRHEWRDLDRIAPDMARAAMAAEDARFCAHWGFDIDAIKAAMEANKRAGASRFGASTITQQVAKNVFLWQARSWVRKGLEVGFTVLIEALWSKRRIIEVYLNVAEFGTGIFGVAAAAEAHFGQSADRLSLTQASRLAAILPAPKTRNPARPGPFTIRRARQIADGAQTLAATGGAACAGL